MKAKQKNEGKLTLLTHVCKYASAAMRQMATESGATEGMAQCYAQLDKFLSATPQAHYYSHADANPPY